VVFRKKNIRRKEGEEMINKYLQMKTAFEAKKQKVQEVFGQCMPQILGIYTIMIVLAFLMQHIFFAWILIFGYGAMIGFIYHTSKKIFI